MTTTSRRNSPVERYTEMPVSCSAAISLPSGEKARLVGRYANPNPGAPIGPTVTHAYTSSFPSRCIAHAAPWDASGSYAVSVGQAIEVGPPIAVSSYCGGCCGSRKTMCSPSEPMGTKPREVHRSQNTLWRTLRRVACMPLHCSTETMPGSETSSVLRAWQVMKQERFRTARLQREGNRSNAVECVRGCVLATQRRGVVDVAPKLSRGRRATDRCRPASKRVVVRRRLAALDGGRRMGGRWRPPAQAPTRPKRQRRTRKSHSSRSVR